MATADDGHQIAEARADDAPASAGFPERVEPSGGQPLDELAPRNRLPHRRAVRELDRLIIDIQEAVPTGHGHEVAFAVS